MQKAIITVVGKDTVGIIAKVCTYLSEEKINILDISQTITGGYFNMMMVTDIAQAKQSFADIRTGLEQIGKEIGVQTNIQLEEIFDMMHRI